ncbi:CHAP domain-containing protein [Hephaestia sp. GCM10023244]|uniref:CHAP domain-containing protein n=1 Tax=unclassified Hephaestia TaxID=2631281 RepID=UPI0020776538|nr:CHAP domain-containing protein [Hephaestia sp. MAHUQ-44]
MRFPPIRLPLLIALAMAIPTRPAGAQSLLDYVGECVPFARAASGIQIYGDAWTWWGQAEGRYQRGHTPRVGSVIVFPKSPKLRLGHVAVISRIVDSRVALVTHANWSRVDGKRGHAEQDVTLYDVSKNNDWSEVRVWYRGIDGLGGSIYPVAGFIYPAPARNAPANVHQARAATELTGRNPDFVAALIDAYARN